MTHTPSIDYSCSHCGTSQSYQVVPSHAPQRGGHAPVTSREIPSIDLSCSRCGTSQTYRVVPVSVVSHATEQ